MPSGFKEAKMLALVGANLVITKLPIKFALHGNFFRWTGIRIWIITKWLRKGGSKRHQGGTFLHVHSAHDSNLGETYLRFSELNSDSRNRRNWSRPTWSFNISSKEKPHLFTRCWLGSLLWGEQRFKKWSVYHPKACVTVSPTIQINLAAMQKSQMQTLYTSTGPQ